MTVRKKVIKRPYNYLDTRGFPSNSSPEYLSKALSTTAKCCESNAESELNKTKSIQDQKRKGFHYMDVGLEYERAAVARMQNSEVSKAAEDYRKAAGAFKKYVENVRELHKEQHDAHGDNYAEGWNELIDKYEKSANADERLANRLEKVARGEWKGLGAKVSATTAVLGIIAGIYFLSSSITGNAIIDLSAGTSSGIGVVLVIISLVAGFFWLKNR